MKKIKKSMHTGFFFLCGYGIINLPECDGARPSVKAGFILFLPEHMYEIG